MAAAVSKIMRAQDLILAAKKCRVVTRFRNTLGLPGDLATRLQPNHPTDDRKGIAASILDGLLYGSGDAVIGVNPATDHIDTLAELLKMLDSVVSSYRIPTQFCVLAHLTSQLEAMRHGAPIDLFFQSISGTEAGQSRLWRLLELACRGGKPQSKCVGERVGDNVMYFETGQGSALSAGAHHGVDQQTCEARAYAVARKFNPLIVNTWLVSSVPNICITASR